MEAVVIDPPKLQAWGTAVGAMFHAQEAPSRKSWTDAAQAWEALACLCAGENDRLIYEGLAVTAREKAREV